MFEYKTICFVKIKPLAQHYLDNVQDYVFGGRGRGGGVSVCVCPHISYAELRSAASPVYPSPLQPINSVIATLRHMHRLKQIAKREGVRDAGSCCPNEFSDEAILEVIPTSTGLIKKCAITLFRGLCIIIMSKE